MRKLMIGRLEKWIAEFLKKHLYLRQIFSYSYRKINYHIYGRREFSYDLHEGVSIKGILSRDNNLEAFFGYYDKSPWSFDSRYYLVHVFDRREKNRVKIAVYNCEKDEIEFIDKTPAFNYQQGAMLRWLNQKSYQCIYNTVEDENLVAKIRDAVSGKEVKTVPMPIQTINPEGTEALTLNYKRLAKLRPEYGYSINVRNFSEDMSYEEDGIWKIDLKTGRSELIISLSHLISFSHNKTMDNAQHKINHIVYSPSGKRFAFMHRWIGPYGKHSRLFTANTDGSELYCLASGSYKNSSRIFTANTDGSDFYSSADDKLVSHYFWCDDKYLIAAARKTHVWNKYFLFKDKSADFDIIGDGVLDIYGDGHPHVHYSKKWIVTDTYPNKARVRKLLLYNLKTNKLLTVGVFFAPLKYDKAYRCDLHPRWSPDGTKISIDSAHEGFRNSYIIDVTKLVSKNYEYFQ